ncbi:8311_t:CDS:2, partial [Scutellospora calospora]
YILARKRHPKGQNIVIFKLPLIILDLFFDIFFIIVNGHDVPFLFVPSLVIVIVSVIFNFCLSTFLLLNEIRLNEDFRTWFTKYEKIASIFTLIASADVATLNILTSRFAGFKFLFATFSIKAERLFCYGAIVNSLIKDIPQLVIQ